MLCMVWYGMVWYGMVQEWALHMFALTCTALGTSPSLIEISNCPSPALLASTGTKQILETNPKRFQTHPELTDSPLKVPRSPTTPSEMSVTLMSVAS